MVNLAVRYTFLERFTGKKKSHLKGYNKCYKTENMYPTRRSLANDSTHELVINRYVWFSIDFSAFSKPYPNTRYYLAASSYATPAHLSQHRPEPGTCPNFTLKTIFRRRDTALNGLMATIMTT